MTNHPHPDPFWTFEHTAWERSAWSYHNFWTRLTSQTIEPLLSTVQRGDTTRLLDVATGAGNVAQVGVRKELRVVGIDFSTAMLAQARKQYPDIDFWATPETAIGFQIMLQAIETYGDPNVPLPKGPPFFRFSDPAESERTLRTIGFASPSITKIQQIWRLSSPDDLFVAFYKGTARTGGLLRAQSRVALNAIRTAVIKAASAYEKDGIVEIPMPAILTSAQKPRC